MVRIVGHRGARNLWPENGLDGFRRTRDLGIEGVEFDVHIARDGELVVIHDPTLDRTTEGRGPVAWKTSAELAATRLNDGNGEGVPTLDAVLDVFAGSGMELHIEIKTDSEGRLYKGLEQRLLDVIARRGLEASAILTCFVPAALETIRGLSASQRVLASVNQRSAEELGGLAAALDRFIAIDGCLVAVEKGLLADNFAVCLERLGTERLGAWVPNEPADIAGWLARPIRQITTDRPDIALQHRVPSRAAVHND
ncbi:MAG: glycerophosphodiester phosphodiesterase [Proteobacteria bacterium]|nr:glycerophosphodiester phosphodiesterase [Pseudomonadota bacterium]MBS0550808.1 glycerophosphodiester phosphodiesterase [Pseudomonadota bacterium]